MRLQLLAIALFITIPSIYGMQDPSVPATAQTEELGDRVPTAKITIEQCSQCNKPAAQKCSICKLTFYCSQECQTAHWNTHKVHCRQLQKAHRGHIGQMQKVFSAYIDKAIETGEQKYVDEALAWHMEALIRMSQDLACLHKESLSLELFLEGKELLDKLVAHNICESWDLQKRLNRAKPAAIAKVRELTIADKLVPPYGVKRQGKKVSPNREITPDECIPRDEFVPREEWKERRLAALGNPKQSENSI